MRASVKVALIAAVATVAAAIIAVAWPKKPDPPVVPSQAADGNSSSVQIGDARDVAITTIQGSGSQEAPCAKRDLALTMEVDGHLIPGRRGGSGDRFASGRLYQFTLANTSAACIAIIKNIELLVLAAVQDSNPAMEATTAKNDYEVLVDASDVGKSLPLIALAGAPQTKWGYAYTPKALPDRFGVHVVPTKWGYSFAIQFIVSWYDPKSSQDFKTESPVYAAFFPEAKDPLDSFSRSSDSVAFRDKQRSAWSAELGMQVH